MRRWVSDERPLPGMQAGKARATVAAAVRISEVDQRVAIVVNTVRARRLQRTSGCVRLQERVQDFRDVLSA